MAHCNEAPASLLPGRPDLSNGWESLVMCAIEKDTAERFQTVAALQDAVEKLGH